MCNDQAIANHCLSEFILPITRYRVRFSTSPHDDSSLTRSAATSILENLSSSHIWRGVFGKCLRASTCVAHSPCEDRCEAQVRCLYGKLFESVTLNQDHLFAHLKEIPHPYSLYVEGFEHNGNCFQGNVELTLFGLRTLQANVQILTALLQAAQTGIGSGSRRKSLTIDHLHYRDGNGQWQATELKSVASSHHHALPLAAPPCPDRIALVFISPMRLYLKGKLVKPTQLEFGHVFNSLLRRISSLCAFYGEPLDMDKDAFRSLTQKASSVQIVEKDLDIKRDSRWSANQQKRITVDGLTGRICVSGKELNELWPYLWLGTQLQTGKGTTMGFGRFTIEPD